MMKHLLFSILVLIVWLPAYGAELSQSTAVRLQKASEQAQAEKIDEAIKLLHRIKTSRRYDRAVIARMLGIFYWQSGDIQQALIWLGKAVDSGEFNGEQYWTTEKMLADLLLNDGQYEKAMQHYYRLAETLPEGKSGEEIWLRITQAGYQAEKWQPVLNAAQKYERVSGKNKQVSVLSMKLGAQLSLHLLPQAVDTLKVLLSVEPDNLVWWQQLSRVQLQQNQHKDAMNTLAMAKVLGVKLSQQDIRLLAQLYVFQGIPGRGAALIAELEGAETDIDLIVVQAEYWQAAKEWDKAILLWQRAAESDEKYYGILSRLLIQQGRYSQALIYARKAHAAEPSAATKSAITYLQKQINLSSGDQ